MLLTTQRRKVHPRGSQFLSQRPKQRGKSTLPDARNRFPLGCLESLYEEIILPLRFCFPGLMPWLVTCPGTHTQRREHDKGWRRRRRSAGFLSAGTDPASINRKQ